MVNVHNVQVVVCGQYCLPCAPRVYNYIRIGYCILVFTILLCGGICGWNNDKGLCSKFVHINCVDRVVDGPHGW